MIAPADESLIIELELAVKTASPKQRTDTLRQVAELFLNDADRLTNDQIKVFDDVLCLLIERIELGALTELSRRFAPVDNAPIELIKRLASHDEIVVAKPVLTQSKRLTANDLANIARTKSQAHQFAICERDRLEDTVTDVLLKLGNHEVLLRLATNTSARFSETGYSTLVNKAASDGRLAETVGLRLDLPPRLLRALLERATEAVRSRILALAPPQMQDEIQRVIADIATAVGASASKKPDFTEADALLRSMDKNGTLNENALLKFANQRRFEEMTVALALLCSASIKTISRLLIGVRSDAVLIPCKAADLSWSTVEAILRNRHSNHKVADQIIEIARKDYAELSVGAAQRTLRFMHVRDTIR